MVFVGIEVGIELAELLFVVGAEVTIGFELEDFAGEAGKGVKETRIVKRIFREFLLNELCLVLGEEIIVLAGDELEIGFGESGGVAVSDHFESGFAIGADFGQALLLFEIALVTVIVPAREAASGNWAFGQGGGGSL